MLVYSPVMHQPPVLIHQPPVHGVTCLLPYDGWDTLQKIYFSQEHVSQIISVILSIVVSSGTFLHKSGK